MQYDDPHRPLTDPETDESGQQTADADDAPVAEYTVVDETPVEDVDTEDVDAEAARNDDGTVSAGDTTYTDPDDEPLAADAVTEDPVSEEITEDTHPANVQPLTPDLGGVQPADPDLGTGEPVDPDAGTEPYDEGTDADVTDADMTDAEVADIDTEAADTDADGRLDNAAADADSEPIDSEQTDTELVAAGAAASASASAAGAGTAPDYLATPATEYGRDPLRDRWHTAQHLFVDDPSQAVHEAAALVQEAAEQASAAVHDASASDGTPDTEQLRVTMQHFHEVFDALMGIASGRDGEDEVDSADALSRAR